LKETRIPVGPLDKQLYNLACPYFHWQTTYLSCPLHPQKNLLALHNLQVLSLIPEFECLGQVVRKPVNINPGSKVNLGNDFSSTKMLSTAYVLCSLRLLMLKTEGQKM